MLAGFQSKTGSFKASTQSGGHTRLGRCSHLQGFDTAIPNAFCTKCCCQVLVQGKATTRKRSHGRTVIPIQGQKASGFACPPNSRLLTICAPTTLTTFGTPCLCPFLSASHLVDPSKNEDPSTAASLYVLVPARFVH